MSSELAHSPPYTTVRTYQISMAEVIGLVASLAALATTGIGIVKTLNLFVTAFARANQQIENLTANVSLTSNVLQSLSEMIDEYKDELGLTVDNFIAARDICNRNFQRLLEALHQVEKNEETTEVKNDPTGTKANVHKAKKGETKHEIRKKQPVTISVWDRLLYVLGGADALKDLIISIEASKSTLQLLLQSLQLLVFKHLARRLANGFSIAMLLGK